MNQTVWLPEISTLEGKIGAKGRSKREKKGKNKIEKGKEKVLSVSKGQFLREKRGKYWSYKLHICPLEIDKMYLDIGLNGVTEGEGGIKDNSWVST